MSRILDDEAVLLDLESERYFGLNAVGTRVWQLISDGKPYGEIVSTLLAELDVAADVLDRDVGALIETLEKRKLVRRA